MDSKGESNEILYISLILVLNHGDFFVSEFYISKM